MRVARAADISSHERLEPVVEKVLAERGPQPLLTIASASGQYARTVLQVGLPKVADLIDRFEIEPFVEIAQASRNCIGGHYIFSAFLPSISGRINTSDDLKGFGLAFADMLEQISIGCGGRPQLLEGGLPLVANRIGTVADLRIAVEGLCVMGRECGDASNLFHNVLPEVRDLIESYGIAPFVRICQIGGRDSIIILRDLLVPIKYQIDSLANLVAFAEAMESLSSGCKRAFESALYFLGSRIQSLDELKTRVCALTAMARTCGYDTQYVFPFLYTMHRRLQTPDDLAWCGSALLAIIRGLARTTVYLEGDLSSLWLEKDVFSGLPATKDEIILKFQQELEGKREPYDSTNDIVLERGKEGECVVDLDGYSALRRLIGVLEDTDFERVGVEGI